MHVFLRVLLHLTHQPLHFLLSESFFSLAPVVVQKVILVVADLCDAIFALPHARVRHPKVPVAHWHLSVAPGTGSGRRPRQRTQAECGRERVPKTALPSTAFPHQPRGGWRTTSPHLTRAEWLLCRRPCFPPESGTIWHHSWGRTLWSP